MEHESYVSMETAKLLKHAGFDWKCIMAYDAVLNNHIGDYGVYNHNKVPDFTSAPTLAVAQKWLRENFKIDIHPILADENVPLWYVEVIDISIDNSWGKKELPAIKTSFTYEDALDEGIKKCLEEKMFICGSECSEE